MSWAAVDEKTLKTLMFLSVSAKRIGAFLSELHNSVMVMITSGSFASFKYSAGTVCTHAKVLVPGTLFYISNLYMNLSRHMPMQPPPSLFGRSTLA